MKLSQEEYRRGVLSWNIDSKADLRTSTADTTGTPPIWSDPLKNSSGSIVQSPNRRYCALRIEADDETAINRPFQVRWEHAVDNSIATRVFDNSLATGPTILIHVSGYGIFHRLVVNVPYLGWEENAILKTGDVTVRFIEGMVDGERVTPFDTIEADGSMTGGATGESIAEGRFIEIVVRGETPEDAELRSYTILGLLAMIMGDHAVGEVVYSEAYETSEGKQFGSVRIPVTAKFPRLSSVSAFVTADRALEGLLGDGRRQRALILALRWYERSVRIETPLDKLLACVTGIETIVNAYVEQNGPVPESLERAEKLEGLRVDIVREFGSLFGPIVCQRIQDPTLAERFRFYASAQGWDKTVVEEFRQVVGLRNRATHGSTVVVNHDRANDSKKLLTKLIISELELPSDALPDPTAEIISMKLTYELPGARRDKLA